MVLGGVGVLVLVVAVRALRRIFRLRRACAVVRRLEQVAEPDASLGAFVVETPAPIALTAGTLRHKVYLSRGVLWGLSPSEVAVVLFHEKHHAQSRDPLWRTLATVAAAMHMPWIGTALLRDLHLAMERACDEAATEQVGSRSLVASTILKVSRLLSVRGTVPLDPSVVGFGGHHVVARVESLLRSSPTYMAASVQGWVLWLVAVVLVLLAGPTHHLAETVLGLLVE